MITKSRGIIKTFLFCSSCVWENIINVHLCIHSVLSYAQINFLMKNSNKKTLNAMNERWNIDRKIFFRIFFCLLLQTQKAEKNCDVESIKISYSFALFTSTIFMHEKL